MKKKMTEQMRTYLREIGKKGGNTTKKRYGLEHFKTIRKKKLSPPDSLTGGLSGTILEEK